MIQHNHEQHHIGYFDTPQEAARAYDLKAIQYMGPTAPTNFPLTDYESHLKIPSGPPILSQGPGSDTEEVCFFHILFHIKSQLSVWVL
jgi:hypothetical protein